MKCMGDIAVVLAMGAITGSIPGCSISPLTAPVTVTVTSPQGQHAGVSTEATAATSQVAAPTGPKAALTTDGTFLVGTDIYPGVYRSSGGGHCYWARLNSLDTSDIINNNNSSGPQVVEILPSDKAFLTEGCQTWALAMTPTAAPAPPVTAAPIQPLPTASAGFSCTYRAALALRTQLSTVLICDEGTGGYTYKGLRLKDGARIDVPGAIPTGNGFTATNNGTRYDVSPTGLVIQTPDGEVYTEPAIASG